MIKMILKFSPHLCTLLRSEDIHAMHKHIHGTKGVVSSYQIGLILPSVAETHPKIYPSRCNLQFSICRHAGGKVSSLGNHHSLF